MSPPSNKSGKTPGWGEREPLKAKWSIPNANKYTPVILKSKEARISFFYLTVTEIFFCFNCCRVKPKTMKLVFAASPQSTQY